MIRTYQYRLYPTDEQQSTLNDILDMARWLYNRALAYRRKRWDESRCSVTYDEQAAMWRDWRNEQPDDNPLRLLNMSAGQQVLRRLDKAYREFLSGKRGKPRFKGRRFFRTVNYKPGDGAGLQNGRLYIQNVVARRQKGSKRREKAVHQLAKEHEHIANQRRDWWHQVTCWLVATYGLIALEDLQLAFLLRGNLARAAHDVGLGLFHDLLDYKAMQAGVQIVQVNPYNTSQLCSGCGELVPKDLSVRVHCCPHCGFTADRDVNAALLILLLGLGWDASVKRQRSGLPQA